jgi:hypothetical protein
MSSDAQFGLYYVHIAVRDSNGYAKGVQTSPDSVANDTKMQPLVLLTPVSFTPPTPTYSTITERGGQKILSQASMGVSELGTATLEVSAFDDTVHALISGTIVDTGTPTGFRQSAFNANQVTPLSFVVMLSSRANSRSGSTITSKWNHWIMPNCQIRPAIPNASQNDGVNPNTVTYSIVPNVSTRAAVTGELFSATAMAVTDNSDSFYRIQTANPLTFMSYTGTGSANPETWTPTYLPLTSHATTSDKILTENGVSDAITAFSITTGVLTTATAGAAGNIYTLAYETNFVTSP